MRYNTGSWQTIAFCNNIVAHCGSFKYGKFYEFLDKWNNIEVGRIIRTDMYDEYSKQTLSLCEFSPPMKKIKIEDIFGFRELGERIVVSGKIELTAKDLLHFKDYNIFEEIDKLIQRPDEIKEE